MRIEIDLTPEELRGLDKLGEHLENDLRKRGEDYEVSRPFALRMILRGAIVASRIGKAGPPPSQKKKARRAERERRLIPGPDDTAPEGVERW